MLPVLAALQIISFSYGQYQSTTEVKKSFSHCEDIIKDPDSNLALSFQCLVANYNLTATLEDVLFKMDQIQKHLNRISLEELTYKPSPFKNIDDILEMSVDISKTDCQTRQQILQGIRRKLEWHNLMNEKATTLFAWPTESSIHNPQISQQYSKIQRRAEHSNVLSEVRCLLAKAIELKVSYADFNDEF
ncbi:uncharacterized protein LOC122819041 isoform X2 [Drosophila biarmipes]|uniref:uncharacterized protein LOC122819041 isoform X2 n=1 Tax=Drosophila biarmipes TaxID=125945 RepID=UPI0021CC6D1E|nr:uncharacterized protein LOC122819041 isoform X2 [Drosophila biarmipes]